MRRTGSKFETFGDGVLTVCGADKRTIVNTKAEGIRYGNKTIGERRFWDAKVAGTVISAMVCILPYPGIERDDIVLIRERQYRISQVQHKFDAAPPCLYLTLESVQPPLRDERWQ
ncbi:MAG: hypothetical protein Q4C60_07835 [Eubacteriales bacterium]|nr:hypothetical protein [Eubacteriales bacterium]